MTVGRIGIAGVLGAMFVGLWAADASAFKRTQTCDSVGTYECRPGEEPKPIYWPVRCVDYHIEEGGTNDFPRTGQGEINDELRNLVRGSFERWDDVECADFEIEEGELTDANGTSAEPGGVEANENVVVWKDANWPYRSEFSFAQTSVSYSASTGEISDADIEFNSDTYEFANLATSGGSGEKVDLRNTLMHEIGHFIGLDHPDVPPATMYGQATVGELKKRTLHQDDIDGMCAVYPDDGVPGCNPPSSGDTGVGQADAGMPGGDAIGGGDASAGPNWQDASDEPKERDGCSGCSTSGRMPGPALPLALMGLGMLVWHRRRR